MIVFRQFNCMTCMTSTCLCGKCLTENIMIQQQLLYCCKWNSHNLTTPIALNLAGVNFLLCVKWKEIFFTAVRQRLRQGTLRDLSGPVLGGWEFTNSRTGIGYSQNYFHMVQSPLVMSCTVVSRLPPSQHYAFNPRFTGKNIETLWSELVNRHKPVQHAL